MRRKLTGREKRLFIYLIVFAAVIGGDKYRRRWNPLRTVKTAHYDIQSSATQVQTENSGLVAEMLYTAYVDFLREMKTAPTGNHRLRMKLYGSRDEMRTCNRMNGWAEAFYRKPFCHQYYPEHEVNPYHWMVHEATHQLSNEVAEFKLAKWLEEGLADYFGCSRIIDGKLVLGEIDANTYPVWWINTIATSGDLQEDKSNGSIIPLRAIISGRGGPRMSSAFNLYYVHWWTLTHFLLQPDSGYRDAFAALIQHGGRLRHFQKDIGPVGRIEEEWYAHILGIRQQLSETGTPRPSLTNPPSL